MADHAARGLVVRYGLLSHALLYKEARNEADQLDDVIAAGLLLDHELGPNVNARDADDDTPLINAAASGHASIIALLIRHGAVLDIRNRHGMSALDVCMNRECWEELKLGPGFAEMYRAL